MLKKILNIGVSELNDEILNRKIRIANLIAFISLITLFSFLPLAIYMQLAVSMYLILFFTTASLLNFYLHANKKHQLAFFSYTIAGFIYFIASTLTFGLISNLHYFMIVMCMIAIMVFDKMLVIKAFIALAIISFFSLRWYMADKKGFADLPSEAAGIEETVGHIILFLLFIITAIFFIFFKNDNLAFQEKVMHQKEIIEEKNKDITASITYAKRLQEAILPSKGIIDKHLPHSFILYRPKDIVAGDFYWMEFVNQEAVVNSPEKKNIQADFNPPLSEKNEDSSILNSVLHSPDSDLILFAAADCTGHGVPGAMVSVVCSNALNRAVKEFGITEPGKILDKARELVVETFDRENSPGEKSGNDVKDGMDISIFSLNRKNELKWAGANNSLFILREKQMIEYKPNKQPIGKVDNALPFLTHHIQLQKEDVIYTFTDGFADQFGGPKGKKFKYSQLKELLVNIHQLSMKEQSEKINLELINWQGDLEQVDDILIVGIKI